MHCIDWEANHTVRQYHRGYRKNIFRNQPVVYADVDADLAGLTDYLSSTP